MTHNSEMNRWSRRRWLAALGGSLMAGACAGLPTRPGLPSLRLIGETQIAHRQIFQGSVIGGLSGLDHDPASGLWYALSDDRSDFGPARFYVMRLRWDVNGMASPEVLDVVPLRQPDGSLFPSRAERLRLGRGEVPDPEAIRWRAETGTLLWTSEGDARLGLSPFLRECDRQGRFIRELTVPAMFAMGQGAGLGLRDNLSFEGLTLTPDGRQAWLSMEVALQQDGPVPTVAATGGPCRFTLMELHSGQAVRQVAYVPDAIPQPPVPSDAYADNGVSEILMLDAHRLLVLERAYSSGLPEGQANSLRLYLCDTHSGSDTLAQPILRTGEFRPMAKTKIADFSDFALTRRDNTEGMAWGPVGPDGRRTLVFVSDDNFNPKQVTQFAAFEFRE